jgi:glutaredoxin
MVDVVVYSKPGCCLCDEVKAKLRELQQAHEFTWREVNVLEDAEAFAKFKEEIPVIFIHGRKAFKFHLDEKEFLRRLKRGAGLEPERRKLWNSTFSR